MSSCIHNVLSSSLFLLSSLCPPIFTLSSYLHFILTSSPWSPLVPLSSLYPHLFPLVPLSSLYPHISSHGPHCDCRYYLYRLFNWILACKNFWFHPMTRELVLSNVCVLIAISNPVQNYFWRSLRVWTAKRRTVFHSLM